MVSSDRDFHDAAKANDQSLVGELWSFMASNKSWWLLPILIVFGLLGVLLVLGATGAAPFLYVFW